MEDSKMTKRRNLVILFIFPAIAILMQFTLPSSVDTSENEVLGYGFLKRIPGMWHGPVSTTTPAGNFPEWYVDFRPISAGQVSQFSMLDSQTINNLSFFIVKHNEQLKVAMRTEGCFNKECCVTYEVMDSVDEEKAFYRFSDFQSGAKRAYTEFTFMKNEFLMEVYTNKFNKEKKLLLHSRWKTKLGDKKSAAKAIAHFNYPKPNMIKDFSDVFKNMKESIYYTFENDPYSSASQPYVGSVTVDIKISDELKVKKNDELFVLLTTESLFEGLKFKKENYKYFSKYVYLPIGTKTYTLRNVHPGKYYVYSYNDINQDKKHKSGDYMSSDLNNIITVPENGNVKVKTIIDFVIP